MIKPKAVLISDCHFTPSTLELATSALLQARQLAWKLKVPLILAGDTLDSKAIIRGEVANRLIKILEDPYCKPERTIVLVGNHDLISEKGGEHCLNFLKPYCDVIDEAQYDSFLDVVLIPYQNDAEVFAKLLKDLPHKTIIMHQGVLGAAMGHYVKDTTSLPVETFKKFRVISGHYHQRQTIGTVSYIGNPYTNSFGEASDPQKGFQILNDDGSLTFVPTNLRKHLVIECNINDVNVDEEAYDNGDLVWLKVSGTHAELDKLKKKDITLFGTQNFKLDKIYTDAPKLTKKIEGLTDEKILDMLIDNTGESAEQKQMLKDLWREIV